MRIDGLSAAARAALIAAVADKASSDAPAFEAKGAPPPAPPPAASTAALATPPTSVAMLVALASVDKPAETAVERRRRQASGADRGLHLLETLRDQLSAGLATPDQLQEMRAWVEQAGVPDDPELAGIMRDIELRVRVELAKHDLTA